MVHLQGIVHPAVAYFIWSCNCSSYSPYRFCQPDNCDDYSTCQYCRKNIDCTSFKDKAYFLDFAGGGAVHLLGMHAVYAYNYSYLPSCISKGGTAGLMVCLFATLQKFLDKRKEVAIAIAICSMI